MDDEGLHGGRIQLWGDFNHAWLALFQKQKELMESGLDPKHGETLIPKKDLEKMGKELIKLCDGIEKHGLVDYEYGVWEEMIEQSR